MYLPPKVKPLCPPEQPPRFADVVYAQVTLDDGRPYDLKLDVYQSPEQQKTGPCIVYYFGGGASGSNGRTQLGSPGAGRGSGRKSGTVQQRKGCLPVLSSG